MTEQPLKLWIHGIRGRMGAEIQKLAQENPRYTLIGGSDVGDSERLTRDIPGCDLIVDFSSPDGSDALVQILHKSTFKGAVLIGTTGLRRETVARWTEFGSQKTAKVMIAPNTSIGIITLTKALRAISNDLVSKGFDVELVETHHRAKKDAPSGTARLLANTVIDATSGLTAQPHRADARKPGELGMHAVRGGGVFGEHEVRFLSDHEEVTLSHRAFSRTLFAQGALSLGSWLARQSGGMYGLDDV